MWHTINVVGPIAPAHLELTKPFHSFKPDVTAVSLFSFQSQLDNPTGGEQGLRDQPRTVNCHIFLFFRFAAVVSCDVAVGFSLGSSAGELLS